MRTIQAPRPATDPSWVDTPAARRGAAGERVVREALAAALDDRYALVHNLFLPGGEGDVDAVLIGPRLLVLEVKTYAEGRPLRVQGLRWEYEAEDGRWRGLADQPGLQAQAGARRVGYALRSARLPAYNVTPVVVLVGGAPCVVERPRVPVVRPAELPALAREGAPVRQSTWPTLVLRALLTAGDAGSRR